MISLLLNIPTGFDLCVKNVSLNVVIFKKFLCMEKNRKTRPKWPIKCVNATFKTVVLNM